MWNDTTAATAAAAIWLLLVAVAFVALRRPDRAAPKPEWLARVTLPVLLLVALVVRLLPALWLPVGATYDVESFRLVTDAMLGGREAYAAAAGRHPYLPFQLYILGGFAWLSQATGLPYVVAIKLPSILADVGITWLIYRTLITVGRRPITAAYLGLLYALNPVALLVNAYHGQFESITLLLLLGSWVYWHIGRRSGRSATLLGLAVLNKTWPVIFLPIVLMRMREWRPRIVYTLVALGIPVIFTLLYLGLFQTGPGPMLTRALTHRGVAGFWGLSAVLAPLATQNEAFQPLLDGLVLIRNILLGAGILVALWLTARQRALEALLTVILTILTVTVGFGIQWLLWPVPFALLANEERWLRPYSLLAAATMAVHLFGLHMVSWFGPWTPGNGVDWLLRLSTLPVWFFVIAWTIDRYRRAWKTRAEFRQGRESLVQ